MNISCDNVRSLLPSYLDGELSEEQAAPMRAHLIDCHACRESVHEGTVVRRWLVPRDEIAIPQGFAARVARRAFAGDPGLLVPAGDAEAQSASRGAPILPFVLKLCAVAAAVLFCLSLAIQSASLPSGDDLEAKDGYFFDDIEAQDLESQSAIDLRSKASRKVERRQALDASEPRTDEESAADGDDE